MQIIHRQNSSKNSFDETFLISITQYFQVMNINRARGFFLFLVFKIFNALRVEHNGYNHKKKKKKKEKRRKKYSSLERLEAESSVASVFRAAQKPPVSRRIFHSRENLRSRK